MRALIVDTSTVIIQRLKDLVSEALNIEDIELSVSFPDALKKIKTNLPGIVLLDLASPVNASVRFLWEIKKENPQIAVIVLSDTPGKKIKEQCESAGADYFFDKYDEFEKIPGTIKEICSRN